MSAKGSAAARPATASWNAPSMSSRDSASTIVPPCTSGSKPGLAVNSGSRSTATFTFTVPLRVFHRSIAVDEVGGQLVPVDLVEERDLRMRGRDHDVGAQLLARFEGHAARAAVAHVDARDRCVGAHGRAVRDRGVAQGLAHPAHAAFGEAPRAGWPSPASPTLWWAITYAVPGERGPGPHADDAAHRRARPASAVR